MECGIQLSVAYCQMLESLTVCTPGRIEVDKDRFLSTLARCCASEKSRHHCRFSCTSANGDALTAHTCAILDALEASGLPVVQGYCIARVCL